jgi:competence protein ComEC
VAILRLGEFEGFFTGDITPEVAEKIVVQGEIENVDYIKIPHHGSKNSLIESLLEASSPEVAVYRLEKRTLMAIPIKR